MSIKTSLHPVNFPLAAPDVIGKELKVDIGAGGTTLRAVTTNGNVTIKRLAIESTQEKGSR